MLDAAAPIGREHPDLARALLAYIAERGDLIARGPDGRAFVLLEMDGAAFDRLCAFAAEREDMEDEPDDDDDGEASGAEIHPLDRLPCRRFGS